MNMHECATYKNYLTFLLIELKFNAKDFLCARVATACFSSKIITCFNQIEMKLVIE